jgi:hypothetical protein
MPGSSRGTVSDIFFPTLNLFRFANTITGQFNGHTHEDEFHVYYSQKHPRRAVGAAFNGASVTPFVDVNPSFKYYYVDPETFVSDLVLSGLSLICLSVFARLRRVDFQSYFGQLPPVPTTQLVQIVQFRRYLRLCKLTPVGSRQSGAQDGQKPLPHRQVLHVNCPHFSLNFL